MFLFQETYYVTPGLQEVVDGRVRSLHANHSQSPQFLAADWMKYMGDATTYLAFRLWSSQDVTYSPAQRDWMAEYNRGRPSDAFTQPPDIEYFEQVSQSGSSGQSAFLACCDLRIGANSLAMTLENELRGDLSEAAGFREYRLYRSMGGESRFFRAEFWDTQDTATTFWRSTARRDFMARLAAASTRGAPRFRHYEVLDQLGTAANRQL